jgi:hypothetical protein
VDITTQLTELVIEDDGLFERLFPVAFGEPVGPDGNTYEYGDGDLLEAILDLIKGKDGDQAWKGYARDTIATRQRLGDIDLSRAAYMSDEEMEKLCEGVIEGGRGRQIRCPYCQQSVLATEDAFGEHYREVKCWDN